MSAANNKNPHALVTGASSGIDRAFSEQLAQGVQIQALCPGVVATEFHEQAGIDPNRYPAAIVRKPDEVVRASLAGRYRL